MNAGEIHTSHALLYVAVIGDSFFIMHDNVKHHAALPVETMFATKTIKYRDWKACFQNLKPFENV